MRNSKSVESKSVNFADRANSSAEAKKALLERFKTRLNENLAEQKNHMPPTQNRDRTPRKGR